MALARAMSSRSSEKKSLVAVAAPSLQRACARQPRGFWEISIGLVKASMTFSLRKGRAYGENQKGRRDVIPTAWGFLDAGCCLRRDLPGPSGRGGHGVVLLGSHKGYRVGPPRVAGAKRARTRRAGHHGRIRSDIRAHHSDSFLLHPSVGTTESAVSAPHFRP